VSESSPPLRFLAAVVGGWAAVRAAMLAPFWPAGTVEPLPPRAEAATRSGAQLRTPPPAAVRLAFGAPSRPGPAASAATPPADRITASTLSLARPAPTGLVAAVAPVAPLPLPRQPAAAPARAHRLAGRWSASVWAFVRRGDEAAALASAGTLGGSQIGARLSYRLSGDAARPLSLGARLSAPAGRPAGAEAALGLEWQPARSLPLRLLIERRQALGREGRSAFALLAHGGVHDRPVAAGLRLDAYAQAGIVGARSRDLFADGGARLSLPLDEDKRIRLGAGAWAAAQPGVARFDAGPHASLRLPGVTLALDWRIRLSGDAAPGSGPTATLSTDF
jgi:hypothetical protein